MDATQFEARIFEAGTDRQLATVHHRGTNDDWYWAETGGPDVGPFLSMATALMDCVAYLIAGGNP